MRTFLLIFNYYAALVAVFGYLDQSRLATATYAAIVLVQLLAVGLQIVNRRFLTAVFGASFTVILGIAVLVEWTPEPNFDPNLTAAVYQPQIIARAYNVLLLTTSLFHALTLQLVPFAPWQWPEPDEAERQCARRLLSVGLVLTPLLMFVSLSGSLITDAPYASEAQKTGASAFQSSGLSLISVYCLVMTIVAAARLYGVTAGKFIQVTAFCTALVFYCRMMRGDRGGALVFFATIGLLFYRESTRPFWQKVAMLLGGAVGLFAMFEVWGFVRANAHEIGFVASITRGWRTSFYDAFVDTVRFDPLNITLFPQSYWHLLHAVDLYDSGICLNGETIYALIPQSVPAFVADAIGLERPMNAAWRLGEYRLSGGGMFIIAEGYWNFGIWGAALVAAWTALCAIVIERWVDRRSPLVTPAYFGYMGTFGFTIYYGLQPNLRALEIAVATALLLHFVLSKHRAVMPEAGDCAAASGAGPPR